MKKRSLETIVFVLLIIFFLGCKKQSNTPELDFNDTLTEEDNDFIESLSVDNPTLHEMYGYYGDTLGRKAQGTVKAGNLIDGILKDAQSLCGQKIIEHPSEGSDAPAHMGLVYSYGQRNFGQRLNPPNGNAIHKKYKVYGTDCSGFLINLFKNAGVNINDNTAVETFEDNLRGALTNNSLYSDLNLENIGWQPLNKLKSGDLILWIKDDGNNHIGIVCKLKTGQIIFQSNGTGTPATEEEQTKNLGLKRGVHPIALTAAVSSNPDPKKSYWGTGYIILRLAQTLNLPGTNYSLKAWRFGDPVPGMINTAVVAGPPNYGFVDNQTFHFNANSTFTADYYDQGVITGTFDWNYALGAYQPDSLFISMAGWDSTNSYGHQFNEGWGLKLPPGYDLNLGGYFASSLNRITEDGEFIYVSQDGDRVYRRQ